MYQVEPVASGMSWITITVWIFVATLVWFIFLYPVWRVWASKKKGEAELEEAFKTQKIQIAQAESRLNAAEINKKAAIVEAEAVAGQIEKIGERLTQHDLYLKWQWIKMMEERPDSSVIYVPTEAGLPILEASRLNSKSKVGEEEL